MLTLLYEPATNLPMPVPSTTPAGPLQGRTSNAKLNKAIETCAMEAASAYFDALGWHVTDVSSQRPYDLELTHDSVEVHVSERNDRFRGGGEPDDERGPSRS